jgi:hypothetical protein
MNFDTTKLLKNQHPALAGLPVVVAKMNLALSAQLDDGLTQIKCAFYSQSIKACKPI